MESLLIVAIVLAAATFATGIVLPLTTRHADDSAGRASRDAALAAELAAGR